MHYFTWKLDFVSNILRMFVASNLKLETLNRGNKALLNKLWNRPYEKFVALDYIFQQFLQLLPCPKAIPDICKPSTRHFRNIL